MGQAHSSQHTSGQRRADWLEFLKLTVVTMALGAVQFARYKLASAEEAEHAANRQRGWRSARSEPEHNHSSVFEALPHDVRRTLITFIDTSITPLLIDQWRCGTAGL